MDTEIAQRLIALNKAFYQNLAAPFSATRSKLQAGVLRVLAEVPTDANVLDLGCGNGGVAAELLRKGHTGKYIGVDFSEELLDEARKRVRAQHATPVRPDIGFFQADLSKPDWSGQIKARDFDFIFAFAVLHHLPGREIRLGFLRQVGSVLASSGRFVFSNWQFLNSQKLKARIQPWKKIGLSDEQVDDGDYLLDWRSGGSGLRYVHHFDAAELDGLAREAGFDNVDQFISDGKTKNLALYQIWKKLPMSR